MPFFSKVKHQLVTILTICEPSEPPKLHIGTPTNFRRGDYTIEGLTEEQQAWIHEKASADASYPSTPGHRLTRSSLSAMSSLPGPIPEPFCEKPRQVPPFPVRRCVSNPSPHPHVRHSLPIIRSQSTGNRLQQYLSYGGESLGSKYAPRYRPVRIEPSAQPLSISEESQDSEVSRDLASRPTSFYSQFSQPSSEVLPNEEALTHIPFPDWPRVDAYNRPFSLDSIPSLPKSRPTSLPAPHFNPAIYDQIIDSEMSGSLISDIESLVEPLSFYQVRMTGSFSQIVQAMMEAKMLV
ncbi:hypothetical protein Vi05172_g9368 [Venturia inaequalis]|nr:hypothetical protein Vi05172_g9368 [Venturia inaequalis]